MNEAARFEIYKKKLDGVCEENGLVYRFRRDVYPITLTIRPVGGIAEQLDMLASAEDNGYTSPDAAIVFSYRDGDISYKTANTFSIDDALFSRIKNLFKKMHFFWLQYFHRDLMERHLLNEYSMPVIDEDDAFDGNAEPLETIEDEPDSHEETDGGCDETEGGGLPGYLEEAIRVVRAENKASVSLLQRRMNLSFSAATALMDELEDEGIIGPYAGGEPREVLPWDEPDDAGT